jgi:hypothetical protein
MVIRESGCKDETVSGSGQIVFFVLSGVETSASVTRSLLQLTLRIFVNT